MRDKIPETTTVSGNPFCSIPEATQKLEHRVITKIANKRRRGDARPDISMTLSLTIL